MKINTCVCEKQEQFKIYYKILAYAKSVYGYINFKKHIIKIYISDNDCECCKNIVNISYCPFCGKELN